MPTTKKVSRATKSKKTEEKEKDTIAPGIIEEAIKETDPLIEDEKLLADPLIEGLDPDEIEGVSLDDEELDPFNDKWEQ